MFFVLACDMFGLSGKIYGWSVRCDRKWSSHHHDSICHMYMLTFVQNMQLMGDFYGLQIYSPVRVRRGWLTIKSFGLLVGGILMYSIMGSLFWLLSIARARRIILPCHPPGVFVDIWPGSCPTQVMADATCTCTGTRNLSATTNFFFCSFRGCRTTSSTSPNYHGGAIYIETASISLGLSDYVSAACAVSSTSSSSGGARYISACRSFSMRESSGWSRVSAGSYAF
jgi:hypothetical protein